MPKFLAACEVSGRTRDAFEAQGWDAWSCDLLPSEGKHIQCDNTIHLADIVEQGWDLMLAFPPCTFLSVSGLHWNDRGRGHHRTDEALEFVRMLLNAPVPRIALENPIGCISTRIRKPDQIIQPYQFSENASKATCLWLKGLPKLKSTCYVEPRIIDGRKRWANQTDSGQNKLGPSPERAAVRAVTYPGIAKAMAEQWGNLGTFPAI